MISGYVENGRAEEGMKLFKDMVRDGFSNSSTLSSVLLCCSELSSLQLGKQVHQLVCKSYLISKNRTVSTSLISMYCKCGDLDEVESRFHEFRSGDRVHPDLDSIHRKLDELEKKMKRGGGGGGGYVHDLESALHDVGDEQKGEMLMRHSEKLAIAYGLMKLPGNVPIRVFKNLRICEDCHRMAKCVSRVEGREIVVRDTTRFHRFRDGLCSCGDYW
ncbi:Pentatricopeptide repeat-containing protein At4g16835, mitochondrial [Linum grandiflorum]